jgi:hypothetical protein
VKPQTIRAANKNGPMTDHDYKEVYGFLRESGLQPDQIPATGKEAFELAKQNGFIPSAEWGKLYERKNEWDWLIWFVFLVIIFSLIIFN